MLSLDKYADSIVTQLKPPRSRRYGTLTRIVGLTLEAKGVSAAVGLFAGYCALTVSMWMLKWLVLSRAVST